MMTIATIATLLLTLEVTSAAYYNVEFGVFFECPSGTSIKGLCGSGRERDCGSTHVGVDCQVDSAIAATKSDAAVKNLLVDPGTNGWLCAEFGELAECPAGEIMIGRCGSGRNADCVLNCPSNGRYHAAIKCARPQGSIEISGQEYWRDPYRYGITDYCPAGQIACGACGSGENRDCGSEHNRMRCCGVVDCSNALSERMASWKLVTQMPTNSTFTMFASTSRTNSEELTFSESYTETVSVSASAGFSFMGASSSVSVGTEHSSSTTSTIVQTASETREESVSFTVTCPEDSPNLWQYEYEHAGGCYGRLNSFQFACAPVVTSSGAPAQPCCLPGYSLVGSGHQECVAGSPNVC